MSVVASAQVPAEFDLKSASLTLVALVLKTADLDALARELQTRFGDTPGLFDNDPVLLDLAALAEQDASLDFDALIALLRSHKLAPVAARGGSDAQMQAARAAGLAEAPQEIAAPSRSTTPPASAEAEARPGAEDAADTRAANDADAPLTADEPEAPRAPPPTPRAGTVFVDKPLRSGQQVYARGGDLVVQAVVSFGAEVIADGSIHVWAPLRGRAIAGARGDTNARIIASCMEPQLISIAGIYRTTETALPADVQGKPAQVRLDGERLVVEALKL